MTKEKQHIAEIESIVDKIHEAILNRRHPDAMAALLMVLVVLIEDAEKTGGQFFAAGFADLKQAAYKHVAAVMAILGVAQAPKGEPHEKHCHQRRNPSRKNPTEQTTP